MIKRTRLQVFRLTRNHWPWLRDQLDRASASLVLNLAEGVGRRTPGDKAHFFAIARGSGMESAAILDVLGARGLGTPATLRHGRGLLLRCAQMLTKLIIRQAG